MATGNKSQTSILYLPEAVIKNRSVVFVESMIALTLLWAILAYGFHMTDVISSPVLVLISTYNLIISMDWVPHMIATLRRVFIAFVATMIIGTVLGISMGVSNFIERMFRDYVTVGMAFPSIFFAVFAAMWFGVGDMTPIAAAAVSGWPIVTLTIQKGVENIDSGLIKMTRSFNVSRERSLRRVVI
ncbi:MAG: ABC transporter permease, partial [Halobacteriaceae archaeon]